MQILKAAFKDREYRKKILMTLLILALCQVVMSIPTPGVNPGFFTVGDNGALQFLNMITGNSLSQMTVGALGITPYITASIIIQLMALAFPSLKEYQKRGKREQDIIEWATIISGTVLSLFQGILLAVSYGRGGLLMDYKWYWVLCAASVWALCTFITSLAGKCIKDKFVGNGISLILTMGILSSYPSGFATIYEVFLSGRKIPVMVSIGIGIAVFIFLLFSFAIAVQEGQKSIPVVHSGKLAASGPMRSEIPLKLCPGSVIPVIFASTVLSLPVMIAQSFGVDNWLVQLLNTTEWFDPSDPEKSIGAALYIILIFAFSIFYAGIVFNPMEIADNLKKTGASIPGIRPGTATQQYLRNQMRWTVTIGAGALCIIALIPLIISGIFNIGSISFLGTSIIIVTGVTLDTRKQIETSVRGGVYMDAVRKGGIFHGKK
ncbi:preprotein translocase subunit SecY [Ruminococcus sp. CLA-AA-H200]|uniref:Protein translocase subunit SecY n=1 Tax=Ruminococcus turbiniformis TaxID=2881258 RepID=A0ABS8G0Y6_9FIRM|nr:preprotein translocase subunit SecY [Ruminococcus turbiniformis]MCC2254609.1 preprotein translocase subunit SecY [Ruminococcus turbiniformis]